MTNVTTPLLLMLLIASISTLNQSAQATQMVQPLTLLRVWTITECFVSETIAAMDINKAVGTNGATMLKLAGHILTPHCSLQPIHQFRCVS